MENLDKSNSNDPTIWDDYVEYQAYCNKHKVTPITIKEDFYTHWEDLIMNKDKTPC